MKKILFSLLFFLIGIFVYGDTNTIVSSNEACFFNSPLSGTTWKLAPTAGALSVGPNKNDLSWWSNTAGDVTTRACLFDDTFVFNTDGSFSNVQDGQTWLETWQGVGADACGTPVAPHDGSNAATWAHDETTGMITLTGVGAHLGLPKAVNGGELSADNPPAVPNSITYEVSVNGNTMTVGISVSSVDGYWQFTLQKCTDEPAISPLGGTTWKLAPIADALSVGPNKNDLSWWSNTAGDVTTRACLFDDTFVFNTDGSFSNVQDGQTWLETWQGVGADACGTPVAPHDGSNAATWAHDETTGMITLTGVGAHLGLPKAVNGGELSADNPPAVPNSITYEVSISGNTMTVGISVSSGDGYWQFTLQKCTDEPATSPLGGTTWKLAPIADALSVGPNKNDLSWWSNTAGDVTTRACLFDDTFVFNADGSFSNVQDGQTWLETWQGVGADACGTPVAPHDGSNAATWAHDETTGMITLTGVGAHLGLPKAVNGGELSADNPPAVPNSITYEVSISGNTMTVGISVSSGDGYWQFTLQKCEDADATAPTTAAMDPNPCNEVISIFSDAFTDQEGTTLDPNWDEGSGTVASMATIAGNSVLKYTDFDFQGIQLSGATDVSAMTHLHVDVWTPDGTTMNLYTINSGDPAIEKAYTLNLTQGQWNSFDIPLTAFSDVVDLTKIDQFKFADGDGQIYFVDNLYFYGDCNAILVNTVALPMDFECEHTNYEFGEFGGIVPGAVINNPSATGINTSTRVARLIKLSGSKTYGGTFISLASNLDIGTNTVFKMKVYSPNPSIMVKLKLEHPTNPSIATELGAMTSATANVWEELSFDFAGTSIIGNPVGKVILIFDATNEGDGSTYYFDDILQMGSTAAPNCEEPTAPEAAASNPPPCDNVISIFSDVFTNQAGTNLDPDWDNGAGTVVNMETINGDNVLKFSNFTSQGIILSGPTDLLRDPILHLDIWSPDATTLNIYLRNSATATEKAYPLNITPFEWNSFEIPISAFSDIVDVTKVDQIRFAEGNGEIYFMDNLYFYGICNQVPFCPTLVWSDEFDGNSLDGTKWEAQLGDGTSEGLPAGWGNSELQYYQSENATVANGKLTITAKKDDNGKDYTSARLRTKGMGDWTYGRFEASIKLPEGQGLWPAFWMLHTDGVYGPWPASGEIDIMEMIGSEPDKMFGTIHYGSSFGTRQQSGEDYSLVTGNTFNDDFHEFAVEWDERVIRWYVDDYLYFTRRTTDLAPNFWPFNQDFHLLLNLAVGGTLPGSPDATTVFPQAMEVEYVRVYEGHFPYLTGNRAVGHGATNEVYSVQNAKGGSTYNWTVPMEATILSGQGTNSITVDWDSIPVVGTISATVNNGCMIDHVLQMQVEVDIARVSVSECVLENVDNDSLITLDEAVGTLVDDVTNPLPNSVNSSPLVIQYNRNGADFFDNIKYETAAISNADEFKENDKRFSMDLYTTAPVGTTVRVQLENADKSELSFPSGRHSYYDAITTTQNEWERLTFTVNDNIPADGTVNANETDQIVILFAPGVGSSHVFYFDNFEIYCNNSIGACATASSCLSPTVCDITNLTASVCPNGSSGTQVVTVRDANNPNCSASIEAPICSDGSTVDITFSASGSAASSNSFQLLRNGVLHGTGGSGGVFAGASPMVSVSDPCTCDDPANIKDASGKIILFHDVLTFTGSGTITCTSNCGTFLDRFGNPITDFNTSSRMVDFYRVPGSYSSATFTIGTSTITLPAGSCADKCTPIPTMSEWGLIIFGLLMLNLGLIFIYRKEATKDF